MSLKAFLAVRIIINDNDRFLCRLLSCIMLLCPAFDSDYHLVNFISDAVLCWPAYDVEADGFRNQSP